jgi:hypothetical protein
MEKIQSHDPGSGINIPDLIIQNLVSFFWDPGLFNSGSGIRDGKSDPGSGINIRIRNTGYLVYEYSDPDAFSMFSFFRHILRIMFFGS